MKEKKIPPKEEKSLMCIMQERGCVFGLFLADMMRKVKNNIRRLCKACCISETHTLRGKMMKGLPVEAGVYTQVYLVLRSLLASRPSLDNNILLAQLEHSHEQYIAIIPLSHLFGRNNG